jgi:hypothetical protein
VDRDGFVFTAGPAAISHHTLNLGYRPMNVKIAFGAAALALALAACGGNKEAAPAAPAADAAPAAAAPAAPAADAAAPAADAAAPAAGAAPAAPAEAPKQ